MNQKDLTSLGDLSRELGMNKSKLLYYAKQGLLKPVMKVSSTNLYSRADVMRVLAKMGVVPKKKTPIGD